MVESTVNEIKPAVPPGAVGASETNTAEHAGTVKDAEHLVESELLVEDVSIDGMCGVY